eukprot:6553770-Ditylum_brightwellii.AAC.1
MFTPASTTMKQTGAINSQNTSTVEEIPQLEFKNTGGKQILLNDTTKAPANVAPQSGSTSFMKN